MKKALKWIKKFLVNLSLSGNNVECSICAKKFITFLPYGIPPSRLRANAFCPNCYSLERTRIYWKYLSSTPNFFDQKKKIMHVAPEKVCFEKFSKNRNFDYFPVDKFEPGYNYPKGTINMDITNLKFSNNYFDFILCAHVLEHVPNDIGAMKELYRVLSLDGFGIIQVPIDENRNDTYEDLTITDPQERIRLFGQYDHVRVYGTDYKSRLEKAGFIVKVDDFATTLSPNDKFKYGFGKGELLYIVRKRANK